jgi:hypothetical protein
MDDKGPNKPRLKLPQPGEFAAIPAAAIQVEREQKFGQPEPPKAPAKARTEGAAPATPTPPAKTP